MFVKSVRSSCRSRSVSQRREDWQLRAESPRGKPDVIQEVRLPMAHLGHVGALARGSAWTSLTSPDQLGMSRIAPFAPVSSYSDTQGHLVHECQYSYLNAVHYCGYVQTVHSAHILRRRHDRVMICSTLSIISLSADPRVSISALL